MKVWYGTEEDVAPAVEALKGVENAAAVLRILADHVPFCGDAGFACWDASDLREIAERL